jgi:hypothetical protein
LQSDIVFLSYHLETNCFELTRQMNRCTDGWTRVTLYASSGGCLFQTKWKSDPQFKDWIKETDNSHSAYCKLCKKNVDIKTMGTYESRDTLCTLQEACAASSKVFLLFSVSDTRISTKVSKEDD